MTRITQPKRPSMKYVKDVVLKYKPRVMFSNGAIISYDSAIQIYCKYLSPDLHFLHKENGDFMVYDRSDNEYLSDGVWTYESHPIYKLANYEIEIYELESSGWIKSDKGKFHINEFSTLFEEIREPLRLYKKEHTND